MQTTCADEGRESALKALCNKGLTADCNCQHACWSSFRAAISTVNVLVSS